MSTVRNPLSWIALAGASILATSLAGPAAAATPSVRAATLHVARPGIRGGPARIFEQTGERSYAGPQVNDAPFGETNAGYVVALPSTYPALGEQATASFVVPTISCADATLTYPTGQPNGVFLFGGSSFSYGSIDTYCTAQGTAPVYAPVVVVAGTGVTPPNPVHPGDKVTIKVTQTATTGKVTIHDATGRWTAARKSTGTFSPGGAVVEGIDSFCCNGDDAQWPIAAFTTEQFRAGTVDRAALGTYTLGTNLFQDNMVDSSSNLQISTGDLNSTGKNFTETFVSST
jgi:hypothetical protein